MRFGKLMALVAALLSLLLLGNYLPVPEAVVTNYSAACPNPATVERAKEIVKSATAKNEGDTSAWRKTAKVSPAKFPSDINGSYQFEVLENNDASNETVYKLTIHMTGVENEAAIAYAYPHSGAVMLDSEGSVYGLHKAAVSEISIRLRAKRGAGGIALVTCQNHRQSIVSIDLPGYAH